MHRSLRLRFTGPNAQQTFVFSAPKRVATCVIEHGGEDPATLKQITVGDVRRFAVQSTVVVAAKAGKE